ncbi:hypothetical protein OIU84_028675 [Salix udensis]|uniref:Uncharacterized protein n=1 Tax=Salix udensis TaxID=889485 RepID=A0AAD6P9S4_9ROSI|nr:hypothetical protein OIU84_028675 [Salix udensis]
MFFISCHGSNTPAGTSLIDGTGTGTGRSFI